ncbi:hypothetical protein [Flavobacterium sp. FlaQc-30]|uniref:hypothetical protein n=1 Tax=Flavobacterium sp. FlaQc-30 TaxID=3374179 RepID=UPI003757B5BB
MSLIKAFPEVEIFFERNKFSQIELLAFLKEIENKYKDEQLRKSLSSLISLKILQYETFPINLNIVEKAKKLKFIEEKQNRFHPLLNQLKINSIENMAINLNWSLSRTLRLLKQKGISKDAEKMLDEKEFALVEEMFNSRLWGIERIEKTKNPVKTIVHRKKEKSLSKQNDVYSRIEAIGLGKVIYIRKQ